jgi:hypothetical protein
MHAASAVPRRSQNVHKHVDCDGSTPTAAAEAEGAGGRRSTRQLCSYVPGSGAQRIFNSLAGDGTPEGTSEAGGATQTAAQFAVPSLLPCGKASRKTLRPRNNTGKGELCRFVLPKLSTTRAGVPVLSNSLPSQMLSPAPAKAARILRMSGDRRFRVSG